MKRGFLGFLCAVSSSSSPALGFRLFQTGVRSTARQTRMASLSSSSSSSSSSYEAPSKIVIAGAGLHGSALAYFLTKRGHKDVTVVEEKEVAAAASGKGGGFLARDWGSGPTVPLHQKSFALHAELAEELGIESYRRIPVLSVEPGLRSGKTKDICPWLDGDYRTSSMMDADGGAQVAPLELCTKLMAAAQANGAKLVIGKVEGVETTKDGAEGGLDRVAGVKVGGGVGVLPADAVCLTLGPWAALAEEWFDLCVPITGIKSTSIVFKSAPGETVEPYALFCGEDDRFGTHLEVYPRSSGEVYLCGIGGSEYVSPQRLRAGEFAPGKVIPDAMRVEAATKSFNTMSKKLGGTPDTTQACMRPCPPDALPLMGKVPTCRGAYMSAGHNCWGILWAPISGLVMSELILDGAAASVDLSAFAPGRFGPAGSAFGGGGGRGRKMGSVAVGEQW